MHILHKGDLYVSRLATCFSACDREFNSDSLSGGSMKTRVEVENNWIQKSDEIAISHGFSAKESLMLRDECAKELMWFLCNNITENHLDNRLTKYQRLYSDDRVDPTKFDAYWRQRWEFLLWIKN